VKHWKRLLGGLLYAASPRVDWAALLRRTFEVDVPRCASCGGRLRILGQITEPTMVNLVLETLGLPAEAPRPARARDPTALLGDADVMSTCHGRGVPPETPAFDALNLDRVPVRLTTKTVGFWDGLPSWRNPLCPTYSPTPFARPIRRDR
jgi:hypothetical protein